ncbi:MAG: hypothetical protein BWX64_00674 [Acidobacteria bacterium ADurb.Bin051]|nr:MAG: hypothetical protein BWX64_00674 [Acidobacteria bacterium ADurb.Bin051]
MLDEIPLLGRHPGAPLAAAMLRAVERERRALDVAGVRDGDHHLLVGDHVLDRDVVGLGDDLGAPRVAVPLPDLGELALDLGEQQGVGAEDRAQAIDELEQLAVLVDELLPLEAGEALETHLEDRLGLHLREAEDAHQSLAGDRRGLARADRRDHLVEDVERLEQPLDDVRPVLGLAQVEPGPADDHRLAVIEEMDEQLAEGEDPRLVVDDREQDDPERRLHLGELVELVEDDLRDLAALDLEDDPDPFPVALVAQVGDPLDPLLAHQLGDLLDQPRLVRLVRQLGDDDRLPVAAAARLDRGTGPHLDDPPAGLVRLPDAVDAMDEAGGREVRAGERPEEPFERDPRLVDQQRERVADLAQVVGRDVRRHSHRDAGRAVDEQVRHLRREDQRLELVAVVVRLPVDGLLVDVPLEHLLGEAGEPDLGVAHRRRRIAVDRAEVSLSVDEGGAHREVLRHPHHGVVDRGVAMRVVLAHDVADDARGLLVRLAGGVARLPHPVEHPPVHRLEAVAHVGQRPAHDHAHRVIEVAALHLLFDVDRDRPLERKHRLLIAHPKNPFPALTLSAHCQVLIAFPLFANAPTLCVTNSLFAVFCAAIRSAV